VFLIGKICYGSTHFNYHFLCRREVNRYPRTVELVGQCWAFFQEGMVTAVLVIAVRIFLRKGSALFSVLLGSAAVIAGIKNDMELATWPKMIGFVLGVLL
jgi:hypothetical protein